MHDSGQRRDWETIRTEVEAGNRTYNAICRRHRISRGELARRIRDNRWSAPETDELATRQILVDGLYWSLERLFVTLGEAELGLDVTREAAVLHKLATTLDRLIAIDKQSTSRKPNARESREMAELKTKIAERLDELGIV